MEKYDYESEPKLLKIFRFNLFFAINTRLYPKIDRKLRNILCATIEEKIDGYFRPETMNV